MKKILIAIILSLPFSALFGGDFSDQFILKWKAGSALQVKQYVESELKKRPDDPSVLVARSLVAAYLEGWCRGAAKFLADAEVSIQKDSTLEDEEKDDRTRRVIRLKNSFIAAADSVGEPKDSTPKWNPETHATMFRELGLPPFDWLVVKLD